MKIMILASFPAPYRINVFKGLAEQYDVDVFFQTDKDQNRSKKYFVGKETFKYYVLEQKKDYNEFKACLKKIKEYDLVLAYDWYLKNALKVQQKCIRYRIPYIVNCDGALPLKGKRVINIPKDLVKRYFIRNASLCFASGNHAAEYFRHYGADENKICYHPFTSLYGEEILKEPLSEIEKDKYKKKLGVDKPKMVLTIGQFIHRKGFDVLLKAWNKELDENYSLVIVGGGEEENQYQQYIADHNLKNVQLVGFKQKEEIFEYYKAADLFVLPTREDIWGLVVNEAMAMGLPVVSTDMCVAAAELIEDGVNGYIVPVNDSKELAEAMKKMLKANGKVIGENNIKKISNYTYENVIESHIKSIESVCKNNTVL